MNHKLFKLSSLVLILALMAQGCTKGFEEDRHRPHRGQWRPLNPNYLLTRAQLGYTGSTDFAYETWRCNLIYCSTMMQHIANVNGYWVGDKTRNSIGYENAYFERCFRRTGEIRGGLVHSPTATIPDQREQRCPHHPRTDFPPPDRPLRRRAVLASRSGLLPADLLAGVRPAGRHLRRHAQGT